MVALFHRKVKVQHFMRVVHLLPRNAISGFRIGTFTTMGTRPFCNFFNEGLGHGHIYLLDQNFIFFLTLECW